MMGGPKYSTAEIREVWEKEGKQRWDGRTHGRGLGLLVPDLTCAYCNVFESGPRFAAGSAQPLHAKYGGQLEAIRGHAPLAVDVIDAMTIEKC